MGPLTGTQRSTDQNPYQKVAGVFIKCTCTFNPIEVPMLLSILLIFGTSAVPKAALPRAVSTCLAEHSEVRLNSSQTPRYLRVHFSANGKPTLVLPVVYRGVAKSRVLICPADGTSVILGEPAGPKFSDMDGDNYMASKWRVCSRAEVLSMKKFYKGVPIPENESVCLTWEDGEALIYWNQGRYMWKSLAP